MIQEHNAWAADSKQLKDSSPTAMIPIRMQNRQDGHFTNWL